MDFTASWGWPQWTLLILLFLSFAIKASQHGKEKLETVGERKGLPERYNGFLAIGAFALWMFILIAGGFFA